MQLNYQKHFYDFGSFLFDVLGGSGALLNLGLTVPCYRGKQDLSVYSTLCLVNYEIFQLGWWEHYSWLFMSTRLCSL